MVIRSANENYHENGKPKLCFFCFPFSCRTRLIGFALWSLGIGFFTNRPNTFIIDSITINSIAIDTDKCYGYVSLIQCGFLLLCLEFDLNRGGRRVREP